MQRTVTIEDVALASGCSTATVSLALRNKPGVSRATRERVLAAAQSLGYQKISRAANHVDSAMLDVAVVFRTWSGDVQTQAPVVTGFFSWVLTGMQESAVDRGANLLLATIPVDAYNNATSFPERMFSRRLDGLILVGSFRSEIVDRVSQLTKPRLTPIVLVDSSTSELPIDSIESANFDGGVQAARYLIERGHRRIAWFGAFSEFEPNFRARRDGFESALRESGLEPAGLFEHEDVATESGELAACAIEAAANITAFVCCNDNHALSLMRTARQLGKSIPEDISIVGFDDLEQSRLAEPALTTMAIDQLGLGRHAIYALTNRITWPEAPPMRIILRPTLVERDSVADLG